MSSSVLRRLVIVLVTILAIPAVGFAQEAVLTGTVTDSTGGVLPGVTVRAVHEASGNTFEGVTDERGVLPHSGTDRRLPDHDRARGLYNRDAQRCAAARRARRPQ